MSSRLAVLASLGAAAVVLLSAGCTPSGTAAPEPEPIDAEYLAAAEAPVGWVADEAGDGPLLLRDDLPWTDVHDITYDDDFRPVHGFCGGPVRSDADRALERTSRVEYGSQDTGGWIYEKQELYRYEHPIAVTAVAEIGALVAGCGDYEREHLTKAPVRNPVEELSSCGTRDLTADVPDSSTLVYCEVGHDPKGDYHVMHTYVAVDRWLLILRVAHWDADEALRRTAELLDAVAPRFVEAVTA